MNHSFTKNVVICAFLSGQGLAMLDLLLYIYFSMPALEASLSTLTPICLSAGFHGNCHHIPHLYKHMTYQLHQMAWSAGMGHSIIHTFQLCVRQTQTDMQLDTCRCSFNTFSACQY